MGMDTVGRVAAGRWKQHSSVNDGWVGGWEAGEGWRGMIPTRAQTPLEEFGLYLVR